MNKTKLLLSLFGLFIAVFNAKAQNNDDMLNLLINKNLIRQEEADSIRAEAAIKAQEQKEKQKSFAVNARRAIQISGYTQLRFQSLQEAGKPDGLDIRRARLDFRGNVTPVWEYRLQLDMASTPKIIDAYTVFKPYDFIKFEVGQFKIPFSLENLTQSNNMETIERAQVVEALVARNKDVIGNNNGRDIGLQVFGSLFKFKNGYFLDYYAGVFNGAGINTTENNEAKDYSGRLILHPLKGLDIGGSVYNGKDKIEKNDNYKRERWGGEISYTYKSLSIKGEYIEGRDADTRRNGYYAQISDYIWQKKLQLIAKYDVYDANKSIDKDMTTNIIGGFNYYFNDFAKIQVNYTSRNEEGTDINNDIIGVQLQVSF